MSQRRKILCEGLDVIILSFYSRQMNLEDLSTTSDVWKGNLDMTIKSAGSEESGVQGIKSVGGPKNNDLI